MRRLKRLTSILMLIVMLFSATGATYANTNTVTTSNGEVITLISEKSFTSGKSEVTKMEYLINGEHEIHTITKNEDGSSSIKIDKKAGNDSFTRINKNGWATGTDPDLNNVQLFEKASESPISGFMESMALSRSSSNWEFEYSESQDLDFSAILDGCFKGGVTGILIAKGVSVLVASHNYKLTATGIGLVALVSMFLENVVTRFTVSGDSSAKLKVYRFKPDPNIHRAEIKLYYKNVYICKESETWAEDIYD